MFNKILVNLYSLPCCDDIKIIIKTYGGRLVLYTRYAYCLVCARNLETSCIKTKPVGKDLSFKFIFAILCSLKSTKSLKY